MEWQPIETAPEQKPILAAFKDGTVMAGELLIWPEIEQLKDDNGYIIRESSAEFWEFKISCSYGEIYMQSDPTHWMPLPEAPK